MTRQISTRTVSARGVMATAAFRYGFEDFNNGKPFRDIDNMGGNQKQSALNTVWAYERGRLFAAYLKGERIIVDKLKVDGYVRFDLSDIMNIAIRTKAIR
jgi:hypothetical protein